MSEDELQAKVTADCAEQRSMEIINVASGRLDCGYYDPWIDLKTHVLID